MNDFTGKIVRVLLPAQILTATLSGTSFSTAGFMGLMDVVAEVGTPGNGTGILSLQIQTSANGTSGWTNLGPVLGGFTTNGGTVSQNVNSASSLGFVRCVATATGTTPSFPLTVLLIATPQYM